MRKTRFLIVALLLLLAGLPAMAQPGGVSKTVYTCPMHPKVQKDKPGDCPICGMTLEKKTIRVKTPPKKTAEQAPAVPPKEENKQPQHEKPPLEAAQKPAADAAVLPPPLPARTIKAAPPHTVRYDLYVADTVVNYTGRRRRAIAINGSIPAPTLTFTQGDTAEIWVHNTMRHETSIHWHGLILPTTEDGVPYLTTAPIKRGKSRVFRFPIVQNGTYWYHSHTKVQEQSGMYGAFIIQKREEPDMPTYTLVLSEWSNMRPQEIDRSLHNQTDWFGIRKAAVQSYSEAIRQGHFKTKLTNEWKRMLAMDVSDVAYDRFLINGASDISAPQFRGGDRVRLRIVNGGASSYFWLRYAGGKMTVVASDGEDVEPVAVDRLIIAVAETYDVIVTLPEDGRSYELVATPEDRTRYASVWLGKGMLVPAQKLPRLKYFEGMKMMNGMMKMNGDMTGMEGMVMTNQVMDMNTVMYPEITGGEEDGDTSGATGDSSLQTEGMEAGAGPDIVTLNYNMLRAPKKTSLPTGWKTRTFYFNLTGNMNRYVWTIDNKTVSEAQNIYIRKGENIRIVLFNNTMMRHPMHLHGHFFRIMNGQGDYAPLKNVLDIMPMERDTIEFAATASGDWFFHCHILYHMMAGMGRIFTYENSPANPELPNARYARRKLFQDDRMPHAMARIGLETNGSDGEAMLANTRYKLQTIWHLGTHAAHGYESETTIGRYFGRMQWWHAFVGYDYHRKRLENGMEHERGPLTGNNLFGSDKRNLFGQQSNKNNRSTLMAGLQYTLPMLLVAELRADMEGKFRFQLSREDIPVTPRLRFGLMLNTDKEYMAGFRYILTKYFSLSTHYDSDMGLGAGVTITY